jgi:hypothetical protein
LEEEEKPKLHPFSCRDLLRWPRMTTETLRSFWTRKLSMQSQLLPHLC